MSHEQPRRTCRTKAGYKKFDIDRHIRLELENQCVRNQISYEQTGTLHCYTLASWDTLQTVATLQSLVVDKRTLEQMVGGTGCTNMRRGP